MSVGDASRARVGAGRVDHGDGGVWRSPRQPIERGDRRWRSASA
jgi:hypothetical protein